MSKLTDDLSDCGPDELVLANKILFKYGVVDGFGHVSVRCRDNPDHFWLARNCAPALVGSGDIIRHDLNGEWNIGSYTIENAAYDWSGGDVVTPTLSAQLFVRADADPQMVSDVTAALVKNIELVRGVHKAMKPLSVGLMGGSEAIAYHPQAAAAYN